MPRYLNSSWQWAEQMKQADPDLWEETKGMNAVPGIKIWHERHPDFVLATLPPEWLQNYTNPREVES